jgi:hypothetical protein
MSQITQYVTAGSSPVAGTNAFSYYLANTTGNVIANGVNYVPLFDTALVANANYDPATGMYTAPATGTYQFFYNISVTNITAAMTYGQIQFNSSSLGFQPSPTVLNPTATASVVNNQWGNAGYVIIPMTMGDTIDIEILFIGDAMNNAALYGGGFNIFGGCQLA